jgi:hypothetical protein
MQPRQEDLMNQPQFSLEAEEAEEVAPVQTKARRKAAAVAIAEPAQHQPPAIAAPVDAQTAMIQMIERVALNPEASTEKLREMLALRNEIEDRAKADRKEEQREVYYRAMAACQADLKVVKKNKKNIQTNSMYADLAALARQADPIIHRHGFSVSTQPAGTAENGDLRIRWTVAHTGGHIETGEAQLAIDDKGPKGEKNKTALHGFGSTMSYGRRYLKLMLFDIATSDDDDGNAAGADTITEEQFRTLTGLMEQAGAGAPFLTLYGIEHLGDLPAKLFGPAQHALNQKIAARKTKDGADA